MDLTEKEFNLLFHALSDANRRRILWLIRDQGQGVNTIASNFNISLPAVSKHLSILERAGLIRRHKLGRQRICLIQPKRLDESYQLLSALLGRLPRENRQSHLTK